MRRVIVLFVILAITAALVCGALISACGNTNVSEERQKTEKTEIKQEDKISVPRVSEKAKRVADRESGYTVMVSTCGGNINARPQKSGADSNVQETEHAAETADKQPSDAADFGYISEAMGDYGRFDIPAFRYSLPLSFGESQQIVDVWDLGAAFWYGGVLVIADHGHQGFNVIKSCYVGMSARLVTQNGMADLVCTRVDYGGINDDYDLIGSDGVYGSSGSYGDVLCYTCNDDSGYNITMVWWSSSGGIDASPDNTPSQNFSYDSSSNSDEERNSLNHNNINTIYYANNGSGAADGWYEFAGADYIWLHYNPFDAPAGKRFAYWAFDSAGSSYAGREGDCVFLSSGEHELYAIWEDISQKKEEPETTQPQTQPFAEPPTEAPGEATTVPPTEPPTEAPTEAPTEPPAVPSAELTTEPEAVSDESEES